jgi:hypothetical protein
MLVLEQHHLFRFYHRYITALSTMLDEACRMRRARPCAKKEDAADLDADAAATMHALRVGVFISIQNISPYEHAAITHVFDGFKQGCYMLKASINVESGNKVWMYPVTAQGMTSQQRSRSSGMKSPISTPSTCLRRNAMAHSVVLRPGHQHPAHQQHS